MKFNIFIKLKEIFFKSYNNKNSNTLDDKTIIENYSSSFENLKEEITKELKKYNIIDNKNINDFFDKTFDKEKIDTSFGKNTIEDIKKSVVQISFYLLSKSSIESLEVSYKNLDKGYDLLKDKVLENISKDDKIKFLRDTVIKELKTYNINDDKYFIDYFNKTFDTDKINNFINKSGMENMKTILVSTFLHSDSEAVDGSCKVTFKDIIESYFYLVKDNLIEDVKNNKIQKFSDLDKNKNIKEIISNAGIKAEDHNNKLEKKEAKLNEKSI